MWTKFCCCLVVSVLHLDTSLRTISFREDSDSSLGGHPYTSAEVGRCLCSAPPVMGLSKVCRWHLFLQRIPPVTFISVCWLPSTASQFSPVSFPNPQYQNEITVSCPVSRSSFFPSYHSPWKNVPINLSEDSVGTV